MSLNYSLPIADKYCIFPTGGGEFYPFTQKLLSIGASVLLINAMHLEEMMDHMVIFQNKLVLSSSQCLYALQHWLANRYRTKCCYTVSSPSMENCVHVTSEMRME